MYKMMKGKWGKKKRRHSFSFFPGDEIEFDSETDEMLGDRSHEKIRQDILETQRKSDLRNKINAK